MPPSSRQPPPGTRGSRLRLRNRIQIHSSASAVSASHIDSNARRRWKQEAMPISGRVVLLLAIRSRPAATGASFSFVRTPLTFLLCFETDTTDSASPQDLSETDYPPTRSGSARRSTTHITLHSRHISLEHSAASKLRQDQTVNATSSSRPQPSMPRQPHRSRLIQDHAQPSASSPVACRPYTSS